MELLYPELRQIYAEGRLIPFVGAGASMSVEWKESGEPKRGLSWKELVDTAARQLGFEEPDLLRVRGSDLQILEYNRLKNRGLYNLTNWLYSEMRPPDTAILSAAIHAELAKMDRCRIVYTTNFDDFIERAFSLYLRKFHVVASEADMGFLTEQSPVSEIVKFHGDLSHPDAMVLSESDYERRLTLTTPLDFRLRADLIGRYLLFIGYSFRDANVSYLFRTIDDQLETLEYGRRAYITVSDPSDFEFRLFADRNIGVIPLDGGSQSDDVAALLRAIRG
jgi:hypothetical protein